MDITRTVTALLQQVRALEAQLDSPARNGERGIVLTGRTTTSNAAATTLLTIATIASTTTLLEVHVVARRTGGTAGTADDGAGYVLRGVYKVSGGIATQIGYSQTIIGEDQAGWDAILNVSGTNVLCQVTGAVNNNITWIGTARIRRVST